MFLIISSIFAGGIQAGDWTDYVECTPLQGGTYATCNADCNEDNPDCYYGNGIASSDQHCYCWTDMGPALSGLRPKRALITKDDIECTPLQGGTYAGCNTYCNFRNSDCYYGTGAASLGQICYCYTDKDLSTIKPTIKPAESKVNDIECTSLEGGNYKDCNANCYPGNSDCYYGNGAASSGQHCYCYTDNSKHETVKSIYKHKSVENNIECTPLQGGNYAQCNANCNVDDPKHYCYYGNGAASPGQICYCYTDKDLATIKPTMKPSESKVNDIECTPLQGGNYAQCNANCYEGNPDCYYGNGAASSDKICYCYTDSSTSETVKPIKSTENNVIDDIECTPLEGGNYKVCNANCYEGNSDCYYGTGAALNGEHCYCYTDKPKPVKSIECTPLEGGNYADCNANCNVDNPDCYYGTGAASPGQICYCYSESRRRLIMVDDGCTGMIIGGLLISSIIIALIVFYYKQKKDVYLLSNIEFDKQNIV